MGDRLRVMTFNANGIRAAWRKGFPEWFADQNIDILCVQELKAQAEQLDDPLYHLPSYHRVASYADKKGYSGVAIYTRREPIAVHTDCGYPMAAEEGRFVRVDYDDFSVVSLYLPSGTTGDERQAVKMAMLDYFEQTLLPAWQSEGHPILIGSDVNIAHREIDLKNWKSNQKSSGFLPEERAWMDRCLNSGWVDTFRVVNPDPDQYTWWTYRANAYANNVGWRLDYQLGTTHWQEAIVAAEIARDTRFSDHAPLTITYELANLSV